MTNFKNPSQNMALYIRIQARNFYSPLILFRQGVGNECFLDKLNPKYWDEMIYEKENFTNSNPEDTSFPRLPSENALLPGSGIPESGGKILDPSQGFAKKIGKQYEERILESRLGSALPETLFEEALLKDLKFSEKSFCEGFLKRVKHK